MRKRKEAPSGDAILGHAFAEAEVVHPKPYEDLKKETFVLFGDIPIWFLKTLVAHFRCLDSNRFKF